MSETMSPARRALLIGGLIILAVPFVAGILRKSYVHLPREAWVALVLLAMIGGAIGIAIILRGREGDR